MCDGSLGRVTLGFVNPAATMTNGDDDDYDDDVDDNDYDDDVDDDDYDDDGYDDGEDNAVANAFGCVTHASSRGSR